MDTESSEYRKLFQVDQDGYVSFTDIARELMKMQCQYASRYIDGAFGEYPKLGQDLRFKGNTDDYYQIKIHIDDIDEFLQRYQKYRQENKRF